MRQRAVIDIIEQSAPLSLMAEWDHSGVQVASPREEISCLAVCLDPTPAQVAAAVAAGADMVLAHHPLALRAQWTGSLNDYTDVLRLLYAHDMPLYSCHTTLDAYPAGPAAWLPDELGLVRRSLLEKTGTCVCGGGLAEGGFGCVGDLPSPMPARDLLRSLEGILPPGIMRAHARLIGVPPDMISRVAVCTGSGASLIGEAAELGADLYITGDVKYHDALALLSRNSKNCSDHCPMAVLDAGHFSLEEEMMRRFSLLLQKQMQGVRVLFLPGANPFLPATSFYEVQEVLS